MPLPCDLMSISPKLSNAAPDGRASAQWSIRHDHARHAPDVIRRLIAEYECQFKFVVGERRDCDEVLDYLRQFPEIDRACAMLMPLGTTVEELTQVGSWLGSFVHD